MTVATGLGPAGDSEEQCETHFRIILPENREAGAGTPIHHW